MTPTAELAHTHVTSDTLLGMWSPGMGGYAQAQQEYACKDIHNIFIHNSQMYINRINKL